MSQQDIRGNDDSWLLPEDEYPVILTGRLTREEFSEIVDELNKVIREQKSKSVLMYVLKNKAFVGLTLLAVLIFILGGLAAIIGFSLRAVMRELFYVGFVGLFAVMISFILIIIGFTLGFRAARMQKNAAANEAFKAKIKVVEQTRTLEAREIKLMYDSHEKVITEHYRSGNRRRTRTIKYIIPHLKVEVTGAISIPASGPSTQPQVMNHPAQMGQPQQQQQPPPQYNGYQPQQQYGQPPQQYNNQYGQAPPPPQQQFGTPYGQPSPYGQPPPQYGQPPQQYNNQYGQPPPQQYGQQYGPPSFPSSAPSPPGQSPSGQPPMYSNYPPQQ